VPAELANMADAATPDWPPFLSTGCRQRPRGQKHRDQRLKFWPLCWEARYLAAKTQIPWRVGASAVRCSFAALPASWA